MMKKSEAKLEGKTEEQITAQIAEIEEAAKRLSVELDAIDKRYAAELAVEAPDEKRLGEIEAAKQRVVLERDRLAARAVALRTIALPQAKRVTARRLMLEHQAAYEKIRETIAKGNAIFREALAAVKRASETLPWGENHPASEAERLARRILEDAAAAGVEAPVLAAPDRLTEQELRDVQGIPRELAARAEYLSTAWARSQPASPAVEVVEARRELTH
jgi:hypothetical protein